MSLTRLGHGGALECSVELADELIKLVVQGPKRATAGARARECPLPTPRDGATRRRMARRLQGSLRAVASKRLPGPRRSFRFLTDSLFLLRVPRR
jgi:hypothetical protein